MDSVVVRASGLSKRYPLAVDALADVSFEVRRGEFVASLHQVHLATTHADRILALRGGRVVEDAPLAGVDARAIEQIYERNGHGATGIGA